MATMNAAVIHHYGSTQELHLETVPRPEPGAGEVLVAVAAAGINPVDYKTREGWGVAGSLGDHPFPLILGWDVAGTVAEVGTGVRDLARGDAVFGLIRFPDLGRAYAEYATAPADQLAPRPASLTAEQAAAVPLAALTAWQTLFDVAHVEAGQRVLITRGAGGVGQFAVQLAAAAGAHVTATGSARNAQLVTGLGAERYLDYAADRLDADGPVYDVIVDLVQTRDTEAQSYAAIAPDGVVVQIPYGVHADVPAGIRVTTHQVHPDGAQLREIGARIDRGELRVHVEQVFPLAEAAAAQARSESGHTRGKLVLSTAA